MTRRNFLKYITIAHLFVSVSLMAKVEKHTKKNKFNISINGDLDDDLIILRSTPENTIITDIHQMHNNKGYFQYNNHLYNVEQVPGFINFNKEFSIKDNEIYLVCLANEREEANFPKEKRFRTHYKNEKLLFNEQVFLKALMPEYNSVPNYPLWFAEDEVPRFEKKDINGNTYNYYNLFENTIVQFGIIIPKAGDITVELYDEKEQLRYTFNQYVDKNSKYIKSKELLNNELLPHPFAEINNILNTKIDSQIPNNNYINSVVVYKENLTYMFELPYPIMYPNLIAGVSCE